MSAVAAAQQVVAGEDELGYLVLDEAWSLLADPHALRWLQGSWKLARAKGLSHVLVLHRWSDVAAAGDVGSAHRERAQGLLRECETAWLFRQPPDEAREMAVALGLHAREERYLAALPKGVALVRYGAHRSIVRVRPDVARLAPSSTPIAAMRRPRPMNDRPSLGRRTFHGVSYGPRVRLAPRSSLLIVGPTQVGKTSSLVIPALLRWSDALVVTSVKNDVITTTRDWRATLGDVQVLEPGRDGGLTWNPLEGVRTFRHALRVARDLTSGAGGTRRDRVLELARDEVGGRAAHAGVPAVA